MAPLVGARKVIFCVPFLDRPTDALISSLEAAVPLVTAAGWDEGLGQEKGCPYVSAARATLLRRALDAKADVIVFLDYDVSFGPRDLLTLIETPGEVIAGTYRYKCDEERYMGALITGGDHRPNTRDDGCIQAHSVPAGFLKLTKEAVDRFMRAYPELVYGARYNASVDLFNHGVIDGVWLGEDIAFCKRWRELGGQIWIVPNLSLNHHSPGKVYQGNYHRFLLRQPGGIEDPLRRRN